MKKFLILGAALVLLLFSLIETPDISAQFNLPNIRILDPEKLRKTTEVIKDLREATPTPTLSPRATPRATAQLKRKQRVATQSAIQRSKFSQFRFERAKDFQEVELAGRRIKIATREGRLKVIDRGVTALVEGGVLYDRGQLKSPKKRPINILPGDVKKKIPGARDLKLIDEDNPKYQVTREIKGKIFGLVSVRSFLTHTVNAQTGAIIKQEKPWWWKRFVNETGIRLDEGEACPINGSDWCGTGLRCEITNPTGPGTIVPEDGPSIGICRLFPPAAHGKIFMVTPDGQAISLHKHVMNLDLVDEEILDIKTHFSSRPECGESEITEIPLDDQGNFLINGLAQGVYDIYSLITFGSHPDRPASYSWSFSINDGPEINLIDLTGADYNSNNQIRILQSSSLPPPPPLCF